MKTDFEITNVYKHKFQIRKDEIYSSDHDEVKETSNFWGWLSTHSTITY